MKKFFLLILGLILYVDLFAQPKEVTLVVSGEGANKTEATNNALRSAIEQAFGTFVSTNTTILNDEVVKDEIATISSGNIKSYEEIGCEVSDNRTNVTLKTVVSISALVNYAKNHGSSCELDGATFGANLKLFELNKKNSEVALENLYLQLEMLASSMFDYELNIGEPALDSKLNGYVKLPICIIYKANENTIKFYRLLLSTLSAIEVPKDEVRDMTDRGYSLFKYKFLFFSNKDYNPKNLLLEESHYLYSDIDVNRINNIFSKSLLSFKITDNLSANYSLILSNHPISKGVHSKLSMNVDGDLRPLWKGGSGGAFAYSVFTNYTPCVYNNAWREKFDVLVLNDLATLKANSAILESKIFYVRIKSDEFSKISNISISPSNEIEKNPNTESRFPKIVRNGDYLNNARVDYFDGGKYAKFWDW